MREQRQDTVVDFWGDSGLILFNQYLLKVTVALTMYLQIEGADCGLDGLFGVAVSAVVSGLVFQVAVYFSRERSFGKLLSYKGRRQGTGTIMTHSITGRTKFELPVSEYFCSESLWSVIRQC